MSGSHRGTWIVIGVLLAPAVVVPLLVPIYDRTDPTLFGFPFYYWFQFALIPFAAVLTVSAYVLAKKVDRRAPREEDHR